MKTYKQIITTKGGSRWLITLGRLGFDKFTILDSRPITTKATPVTSDRGFAPQKKQKETNQ